MIRKDVIHNMNKILDEVAATDNNNTGILGIGSGNNIIIIIVLIFLLCRKGGTQGISFSGQTKGCCCRHKRKRVRRRSRASGRGLIIILLLVMALLGNNSGRNTNTNIISVNSENRDLPKDLINY